MTDFGFLYIDLFLLTTLATTCKLYKHLSHVLNTFHAVTPRSLTVAYTGAFEQLVPRAPEVSLIALQPILSILAQITVIIVAQFAAFFTVQSQPWLATSLS